MKDRAHLPIRLHLELESEHRVALQHQGLEAQVIGGHAPGPSLS